MLNRYMAHRDESREFFDLNENPFADTINDPEVLAAFNEKAAQVEENRDLPAIMHSSRMVGTKIASRLWQLRR